MPKAVIEEAIAGGGLKPDYNAWDVLDAYYVDVLDAYYADHLSDAALEWLIKNKVIKREQRGCPCCAPSLPVPHGCYMPVCH